MRDVLPMSGFYQFGYVTRAIDPAIAQMESIFGVTRFRRKQASAWMETAHAWTGGSMIEVIALGDGAPPFYAEAVPDTDGALRLHHLGRRIGSAEEWDALHRAIVREGLDVPLRGDVMDGQLKFTFVDTRPLLGVYSEYVFLTGDALNIYDDVPLNH